MKKAFDFYEKNYSLIFCHNPSKGKQVLGSIENRQCRFCGKGNRESTFRKKAHAIPELIGNNLLFTNYECDDCNKYFSETLEDHFSKYLGIERTLSQIKGKKGVPSHKSKDKTSRIDVKNILKITQSWPRGYMEINQDKKQIIPKTKKAPYVPANVFGCLVKMAISLVSEEEVMELAPWKSWLLSSSFPENRIQDKLLCFTTFTPGPHPYQGAWSFIFRRKSNAYKVPYLTFILAFGNRIFQIFLMNPQKDGYINNTELKLTLFPTPCVYSTNYKYGKSSIKTIDLSSTKKKYDEEETVFLCFDNMTEAK